MNLENGLEFVIEFNLLNYELKYDENENEFYVKKGDDWRLKKFSNSGGYLITGFYFEKNKCSFIGKHRLVFYAYNNDFDIFRKSTIDNMIDHIDCDKSNNSIENLRVVTNQENQFNQKRAKGYYFNKKAKKWLTSIRLNGRSKHLGLFESEEEAKDAYLKAKEIFHIIN